MLAKYQHIFHRANKFERQKFKFSTLITVVVGHVCFKFGTHARQVPEIDIADFGHDTCQELREVFSCPA
jgi:hypothetical protein